MTKAFTEGFGRSLSSEKCKTWLVTSQTRKQKRLIGEWLQDENLLFAARDEHLETPEETAVSHIV